METGEKSERTCVSGSSEELRAQLEAKKKEIEEKESALLAQLEREREVLAEKDIQLKEALWQEKLELVEKDLGQLYREKRLKEQDISERCNDLFNTAAKAVDDINAVFKELEGLDKEISGKEGNLVGKGRDTDPLARDAVEFKKAQIERELKVSPLIEGALSLVKDINRYRGHGGEPGDMLGDKKLHILPTYARTLYIELTNRKSGVLRGKEDSLVKLAGIKEPRIIHAREELQRCLRDLAEEGLIMFQRDGADLVVRSREAHFV